MSAPLLVLALALAPGETPFSGASDVSLEASYEPGPGPAAPGAIVVRFRPRAPEFRVNEEPAPRVKLESPSVLVDRQPPVAATAPAFDPDFARYLEPGAPVRFPVALDPKAQSGTYGVRAVVTYAYCSKVQGWCRRGRQPIEVSVTVP